MAAGEAGRLLRLPRRHPQLIHPTTGVLRLTWTRLELRSMSLRSLILPPTTWVADPSPHVSLVPESLSQKTPVMGSSSQKTSVTGTSSQKTLVPPSSSHETPIPPSSSHETPEASGPEDGSEDTFLDDSYSDDELVEKGKKVYKRGCAKLPPVPTTPDQRWLIAPKGLK